MRWNRLLGAAAAVGVLGIGAAAGGEPARRPNVVIIYGDDVGYGDLACYGGTGAATPNVDRLAAEGLRLTSGYCASATCTPSRYSLLTGQYAFRQKGTGILPGDAPLIIEPGRRTLPAILKDAGYHTAAVGKWHLGLGSADAPADWNGEVKPGPLDIGFDYSFIMAATGDRVPCVYVEDRKVVNLDPADPIEVSYEKPFPGLPTGVTARDSLKMNWSHGHNNAVVNGIGRIGFMSGGTKALWVDEEMADVFTKYAVSYIERHKDEPFFLYYATQDVHVPRVPHPRFVGQSGMGPRGDSIVQFDWQVGRILETLDRLKLADDTLVILTSDNGPVLDDGYVDDANEKLGTHKPAGPLRGGKYSRFEGGTRVPWVVRWPGGGVKPGTTSDAIVSQVDLPATLAALAGRSVDRAQSPDSQDVLPALLGRSPAGRDHVVQHANRLALRRGDWKFIPPGPIQENLGPWKRWDVPPPGLLFNLATDPGEQTDLAAQHPDKLRDLAAQLESIRTAGHGSPAATTTE